MQNRKRNDKWLLLVTDGPVWVGRLGVLAADSAGVADEAYPARGDGQ